MILNFCHFNKLYVENLKYMQIIPNEKKYYKCDKHFFHFCKNLIWILESYFVARAGLPLLLQCMYDTWRNRNRAFDIPPRVKTRTVRLCARTKQACICRSANVPNAHVCITTWTVLCMCAPTCAVCRLWNRFVVASSP